MIFGNKKSFAIEIKVNNLFYDKYIGEGYFLVYINNKRYGLKKKYATMFLCISDELKYYYKNTVNQNLGLEKLSKEKISEAFYFQNFTENPVGDLYEGLLYKIKNLMEWKPEAAFDDGSHLIHFDEENQTRIIGFKSCRKRNYFFVRKNSEEEIVLSRNDFKEILNSAYMYLQSYVKDELEK